MSAAEGRVPVLSPLGYGGANLGNMFRPITDDEAFAILDAAWECGIRYYDTAPHYGLGLSERRLGAWLRGKPRDEFVLSTKVGRLLRPNPDGTGLDGTGLDGTGLDGTGLDGTGLDDTGPDGAGLDLAEHFHVPATLRREWDFSAAGIRTGLEESLERLGLDRVDIVYLHDPERYDLDLAIDEALPGIVALREAGLVDAVGVGSMVTQALARSVLAADLDVVMIAGRYTLLEQPAAADVLPALRATGTSAVTASVFNSGLLARAVPTRDGRYEYGELPEELWAKLQRIAALCAAHEVPLPAAALQFTLRDPAVRSVVVGGSRPEQLRQNAEYLRVPIPDALWSDLAAAGLIDG